MTQNNANDNQASAPQDHHVTLTGEKTGPLKGVRVLDFTAIYSGPIATAILGDQGADVIKVESHDGDLMRRGIPKRGGLPAAFTMMNRNKRSISVDLRTPKGKEIIWRMVDESDVLIENFRPGALNRLGFDWDSVHARNPRLIYASINGVGSTGPLAGRRVYDAVIQAISGMCALQTTDDGTPVMVNTLICDKVTALTAAQAVTAALYAREQAGIGQRVELSMLDASLHFLWPDANMNQAMVGDDVQPVPTIDHRVFVRKTSDGYIAVMPVSQVEMHGCYRALGLDELLEDERFATQEARSQNRIELFALMEAAYLHFTTDEVAARLDSEDVPYALINSRASVVDDPQVKAMGALVTWDHPTAGRLRQPRPSAQFHATPSNLHTPTPLHGEHTQAVLVDLGYTQAEVEQLRTDGVIL